MDRPSPPITCARGQCGQRWHGRHRRRARREAARAVRARVPTTSRRSSSSTSKTGAARVCQRPSMRVPKLRVQKTRSRGPFHGAGSVDTRRTAPTAALSSKSAVKIELRGALWRYQYVPWEVHCGRGGLVGDAALQHTGGSRKNRRERKEPAGCEAKLTSFTNFRSF